MVSNSAAAYELIQFLNLNPKQWLGSIKKLQIYDLIFGLISSSSIEELSKKVNISRNTLKSIINNTLDSYGQTGPAMSWELYLLSLINCKRCTKCNVIKRMTEYHIDNSKSLGIQSICKECNYFRNKKYRSEHRQEYLEYLQYYRVNHAKEYLARTRRYKLSKAQRVPKWADLDKIKEIYKKCPEGYHVDHVIPLNGTNVSGLHVENNLQYLSPQDNIAKSNKYSLCC